MFVYALFSRKLTLSRNLAFSAIVLAVAFAILPRIVFGSAYADMRLVPYLMAVALLAIRFRGAPDRRTAQVLAVLGLLFFATRTVANTISLGMAADDQTAKLKAIDQMPRGARVISLVGMTCQEYWPLLRNGHLGAMVIVRRDGFSNDQWLLEGVNLLDLKYRAAGYFAADPSQLVRPNRCLDPLHRMIDESLATLPRNDFDYVWLIDVPPYRPGNRGGHEAGLARAGAASSTKRSHDRAFDRRSLLQRGGVPGRAAPAAERRGAQGGRRGL